MANIATLLKSEISRLCRRELRSETQSLKKASASYRREIAALKRHVAELSKKSALLAKGVPQGDPRTPTPPKHPVRFVAKGLRSLRSRLGLSALHLSRLLGVSEQSIYNWETKKATPRKEQVAGIVALRGIGKREARSRLDTMKSSPSSKRRRKSRR